MINTKNKILAINGGEPVRTKKWMDNFTVGKEEKEALSRVIDSGYLSLFEGSHTPEPPFSFKGGPEVQKLEELWCEYYGSKYSISVNSATSGLYMAIAALGIGFGDEVIVSPYTMTACALAPLIYGAIPVFADVELNSGSLDPKSIEKVISSRTKAIIVVHQFGIPANMDEIMKIAKKHNIKIIEDCAQSQGAKYKKEFSGTIGDYGCFSFYPTKILGAYGDGGFILTNSFESYKKIKRLRFYGIETVKKNKFKNKYYSFENGFNSRLDEIQSSILNFKLNKVDFFIKKRRFLARKYYLNLKSSGLVLPEESKDCLHVYHLFTVFHPKADKIKKELLKNKIQTRTIYPYPIHKMKAYSSIIKNKINLKNSEIKSKGIFSLPLYPELKTRELETICKCLKKILKKLY